LEAAEKLAGEGIQAEVVDLRTLRPLDIGPVIDSVKKTNRVVVVEEGWRSFGVGAEVASRVAELAFDYLDAPVRRVAQAEVPLPYNQRLEQLALPQTADVINAVKDVLYLK
jgi:pyruvate dehydrogenase E1 component beta subunit